AERTRGDGWRVLIARRERIDAKARPEEVALEVDALSEGAVAVAVGSGPDDDVARVRERRDGLDRRERELSADVERGSVRLSGARGERESHREERHGVTSSHRPSV